MTAQLSREQLIADIEHAEEKAATLCGACAEDHARLAGYMRMLLAGMDSEPVYQVLSGDAWVDVSYGAMCSQKRVGATVRTLYAAPPAPVATVPDGLRMALSNAGIAAPESDEVLFATHEKYVQLLVDWVKDRKPFAPAPVAVPAGYALVPLKPSKDMLSAAEDERGADWQYAVDIWYSMCRAAMQAEPVTAATGWIKCGERMPEPHGKTLLVWCRHAIQRGYYGGGNWWIIEGRWTPGERVTHWMPLPAAPEQEV